MNHARNSFKICAAAYRAMALAALHTNSSLVTRHNSLVTKRGAL